MQRYKYIFTFGRVLLCFIIIYFLLNKIDYVEIITTLSTIDARLLFFPVALMFLTMFYMVYKWKVMLDAYHKRSFYQLMLIYWASDFVNLFGLGGVGGESYKLLSLSSRKHALLSSLLDRIYSLVWYVLLAFSFFCCYFLPLALVYKIFIGLILYVFLVALTLLCIRGVAIILKKLEKYRFINKIKFLANVPSKTLILHAAITLIISFVKVCMYGSIFSIVGMPVYFMEMFVLVPFIAVAITLPISFQGIGVREFILFQFANYVNADGEKIIVASFLMYIVGVIYRVTGCIPFILKSHRKDEIV